MFRCRLILPLCALAAFIYVRVLGRLWELDIDRESDDADEHGSAGNSGSGGAIPGAVHVWPYYRADRTSATDGISGVSEQPVQRADVHLSRPGHRCDLDAVDAAGALHQCVERPGPASPARGVRAQRNLGNFRIHDTPQGMAPYMRLLLQDAFSNYRPLMYDVTLSPAMGDI